MKQALSRLRKSALFAAPALFLALLSFPLFAAAPVLVLSGVTATTSTSAASGASGGPVSTGQSAAVDVSVWSTAGGTYTVLLEERASDQTSSAPWVTVATMANCDAAGAGTVTPAGGTGVAGTCGFSTLAPKQLTRLRISAWTSGTVYGVIHVNGK